jgi:hypothetical protein
MIVLDLQKKLTKIELSRVPTILLTSFIAELHCS